MLKTIYRNTRRFLTKNRLKVSTTTGFFRNEVQMETIVRLIPAPRSVYFFGCSDGCEPYTFAFHLQQAGALEGCKITGFDINNECLVRAQRAIYEPAQIDYYGKGGQLNGSRSSLFEQLDGGNYRVVGDIRRACDFVFGSVLDQEFMSSLAPADIVFCQNVLVHLTAEQNRTALENLGRLLKKDSLLVIGGMRPDLRSALVPEMKFIPISDNCREIHDGWRDLRALWDLSPPWMCEYFALEPFRETEDWQARYGSLFRAGP